MEKNKHWSQVEMLHLGVKNPNIHIKGQHSYYSDAWSGMFEQTAVRYLYGDEFSKKAWQSPWPIDQLYIGDYVCIGPEVVILMGGNNNHRMDWLSLYPFAQTVIESYQGKGDTHIHDGAWIGMRAMIMPGLTIGEGAVIGAGAIVTHDVPPYTMVAGNPAQVIKQRFEQQVIDELLGLRIYDLSADQFAMVQPFLASHDISRLKEAVQRVRG